GTAENEAEQFYQIYRLEDVKDITNKPNTSKNLAAQLFMIDTCKMKALIHHIKVMAQTGRPVLVGTISIEKNEVLIQMLTQAGVKHELLNAKNNDREAHIIAQAGRLGSVTLATNIAGRGVDIILGGNPPDPEEQAKV